MRVPFWRQTHLQRAAGHIAQVQRFKGKQVVDELNRDGQDTADQGVPEDRDYSELDQFSGYALNQADHLFEERHGDYHEYAKKHGDSAARSLLVKTAKSVQWGDRASFSTASAVASSAPRSYGGGTAVGTDRGPVFKIISFPFMLPIYVVAGVFSAVFWIIERVYFGVCWVFKLVFSIPGYVPRSPIWLVQGLYHLVRITLVVLWWSITHVVWPLTFHVLLIPYYIYKGVRNR